MSEEARIAMAYWDREEVLNNIGNIESLVIPYFVFNVEDEDEALQFAYENTPNRIEAGEELGVTVYVDRQTIDIDSRVSQNVWKVRVNYPKPEYNNDENQASFSFDTTGGTMRMDVALNHIADYGLPGSQNINNYNGLLNVDENGNTKGVDVIYPQFSFSIGKIFSNSKITDNFKRKVSDLTGCVNDSTFEGWAAGEVLFQGVTGSRRGKKSTDKWELNYKFAVSPNATNISRGGITIPSKKGWQYLWFSYKYSVVNGRRISVPAEAHLEDVYRNGNFNNLW